MLDRMFNSPSTIYKWDKMPIGFLCGLIAPVIGVLLFYFAKSDEVTFQGYLKLLQSKIFLAPLLSLGCVMDAFVFFLFLRKDYYNAARGVILAMFLWAIPILWAKFF
ncbi:MAG TPA: hypothetical protein VGB95_02200 [Chitinophagales bacterium]